MGLDMYLYKKIFINEIDNYDFETPITVNGNKIWLNPYDTTTIEIAYWRKAYAIHKWFVDVCCHGDDDCAEHCVSATDLKELLDICKKVKKNKNLAEQLLPTQGGFFFGSTEYDDIYFYEIDETIKQLKDIFKKYPSETCFYYQASW